MLRLLPVLVVLAFTGCGRSSPPPFERIAILRFENLGGDAATEWMGRAFSEAIAYELAGAPRIYAIPSNRVHSYERALGARPVSVPGISAERSLAIVAGATRVGYGDYAVRGGKLEAQLTLEDPATGRMVGVFRADGAAGDVAGVAAALARQIWSAAPPYRVRSSAVLKNYLAALESTDPAAVAQNLDQAIAADPDFGPAYFLLAQVKAQRQDRAGALETIEAALSHGVQPLSRARLELQAAELRGDPEARLRALTSLAKMDPGDPLVWRSLGEVSMAAHQYSSAANAYRRSLDIENQDAATWNQLGYAAAHQGDLEGAMQALRRYQALRPADSNPLDSMGDVNLLNGRLRDAEGFYLESAKKAPHFQMDGSLFKAAMARLMSGDIAGADGLARRYLDARAAEKDPALDYRAAEWSWAAGRRKEACGRMEAFARGTEGGPLRELASRAYAELAIWKLTLGDWPAAGEAARHAESIAGASSAGIAAVARFLTQAPAQPPGEWALRAEREFSAPGQNAIKEFAVAYALLVDKQFQAASLALKRLYDSGAPADDEGLPLMLGWTYVETGRVKEAEPLLKFNPMPSPAGAGPFFAFYFPRLYYERGVLAARQGKNADAQTNFDLFKKLSGNEPLIWDPR